MEVWQKDLLEVLRDITQRIPGSYIDDIDRGKVIKQIDSWREQVGNVAKPNACPQLADVQTDGVCFICKKPTQNLSPDPTNWRIDLPFNGGNGLTRQYHQGCIVALIDKHFG